MIKLISVDNTVVWLSWDGTKKRTTLALNTPVNVTGYEKNGYSYIDSPVIGWVKTSNLKDPVVVPPPPPPPVTGLNLWRTKYADEIKDPAYRPEGVNVGSFAIMWLLPSQKIVKPDGWNLSDTTCKSIRVMNQNDSIKWNWLVDQAGTRKILSQDEATQIVRLPVPCMSAGNLVNVLEETDQFCRIQTVKHDSFIPGDIIEVPYLTHTWMGYTKAGVIFRPAGGVLWPLLARDTSAWVIKSGLEKI